MQTLSFRELARNFIATHYSELATIGGVIAGVVCNTIDVRFQPVCHALRAVLFGG